MATKHAGNPGRTTGQPGLAGLDLGALCLSTAISTASTEALRSIHQRHCGHRRQFAPTQTYVRMTAKVACAAIVAEVKLALTVMKPALRAPDQAPAPVVRPPFFAGRLETGR